MADDANLYPDWDKPVIKGDLIRAMAYLSTSINALGVVVTSFHAGEAEAINKAMLKFISESQDVQRLIDEISGKMKDGE